MTYRELITDAAIQSRRYGLLGDDIPPEAYSYYLKQLNDLILMLYCDPLWMPLSETSTFSNSRAVILFAKTGSVTPSDITTALVPTDVLSLSVLQDGVYKTIHRVSASEYDSMQKTVTTGFPCAWRYVSNNNDSAQVDIYPDPDQAYSMIVAYSMMPGYQELDDDFILHDSGYKPYLQVALAARMSKDGGYESSGLERDSDRIKRILDQKNAPKSGQAISARLQKNGTRFDFKTMRYI